MPKAKKQKHLKIEEEEEDIEEEEEDIEEEEEETSTHQLKKLNNAQVNALKGKLVEVRKIGATPIFIEIAKSDTVSDMCDKADIDSEDNEIKVEAIKTGSNRWISVSLKDNAIQYDKFAVTTKVQGA